MMIDWVSRPALEALYQIKVYRAHSRGRHMKKIGIVLALIFAMNFGSLVFAQNTNSSTTTSTTTTTTRRAGSSSRRRRMRRHAARRRHRRARRSGGNAGMQNGNGNTRR
jgi:hypothetical protein